MKLFHSSLECVQHGGKPLVGDGSKESILGFAKRIGCTGAQLSHFHLLNPEQDGFVAPGVVRHQLEVKGLSLSGISCHCLLWVHGAAHTGTRSLYKFIPKSLRGKSPKVIQEWAQDRMFELMDLSVELGNYILPTFIGPYWGLEVSSGYPWGMWEGLPGLDDEDINLVQEGDERFLEESEGIRNRANDLGIVLAHEIHRGTGALCARDLLRIRRLAGDDRCIAVNADGTHTWEGESSELRFDRVGHLVVAVHMKDFVIVEGESLSSMEPNWQQRGMYFDKLGKGNLNQRRYVQQMVSIGYPERYRAIQKLPETASVPLVVEAESAFAPLDETSAEGVQYVNENFCGDFPTESFEKQMAKQ